MRVVEPALAIPSTGGRVLVSLHPSYHISKVVIVLWDATPDITVNSYALSDRIICCTMSEFLR